jgi:hypothetical protein
MANSYVTYAGTGSQTDFAIPFPYLASGDLDVYVNDVAAAFSLISPSMVRTTSAPAAGTTVRIQRTTRSTENDVNFTDGSNLLEKDMDLMANRSLFLGQEAADVSALSLGQKHDGTFNAKGKKIVNLADGTAADHAATKGQVDAAVGVTSANSVSAAQSAAAAQQHLTDVQAIANDFGDVDNAVALTQGYRDAANTSANSASASASAATTAKLAAEAARDQASAQSKIYATTAAGLAGVPSPGYFYVPSTNSSESLILYQNNAGVAVEVRRLPSAYLMDDLWQDRRAAAEQQYLNERRTRLRTGQRPKAAIVIMLGQSNNAAFNASISGTVSSDAYMPAGGNAVGYYAFYAPNQAWSMNWDAIGPTPVQHQEGTSESPISGLIASLGDVFPRVYASSVAYGGNAILLLAGAARRANLYGIVHGLCDHARIAGYEPVVMFTSVHGEANMASYGLMTEQQYYDAGLEYYRMCQMVAAQAMEMPEYDAPIVFHTPVQSQNGLDSQGIKNAINRLAKDIPNGMLAGSFYQWGVNTDLIHGSATGFRMRGEYDGWLLSNFWTKNERHMGLRITDAVRSGATITVTFNDEITWDQTVQFGTSLSVNPAGQRHGFQYSYDGTNDLAITGLTIQGRKAILTLGSDPGAKVSTETIRIAMQTTPGTGTWPGQCCGSQIKSATNPGFLSLYDPTYRNYVWAAPQRKAVR